MKSPFNNTHLIIVIVSLLLAVSVSYIVWDHLPDEPPQYDLPKQTRLPEALATLNQHHSFDFRAHTKHKLHPTAGPLVLSFLGQVVARYEIDLCEQSSGYKGGIYDLFVGLSRAQINTRLDSKRQGSVKNINSFLRNPVYDTPEVDDLPGVVIEGTLSNLSLTAMETDVLVHSDIDDRHVNRYGLASNAHYSLLITTNRDQSLRDQAGACKIGSVLSITVYEKRESEALANVLVGGELYQVVADHYPATDDPHLFDVQKLNDAMQGCDMLVKDADGIWHFASRWTFVDIERGQSEKIPSSQRSPLCQKVLASFYHTPAGKVLRQRIRLLNRSSSPVVAVAVGKGIGVSAFQNSLPVPATQATLSTYQTLLYTHNYSVTAEPLWHKVIEPPSTPVQFVLRNSSEEVFEVYLVGRNAKVNGAQVLAKQARCPDAMCPQADDVLWLKLKAKPNTQVVISLSGVPQTMSLLKQKVIALDAVPQISEVLGHDRRAKGTSEATVFSVTDRSGKPLSPSDIPELLAPYGGRITASSGFGQTIQLTIDKSLQANLLQLLSSELAQLDEKPKGVASLLVMNGDGDVLAAVQQHADQRNSSGMNLAREGYEQSYKPGTHWLTFAAGKHDGSARYTSGSTAKLITSALLIETLGVDHPLISGKTLNEWRAPGLEGFDPRFSCYPVSHDTCGSNALNNFAGEGGRHTLFNRAKRYRERRYGLDQALRDSLNSYFAALTSTVAQESVYGHYSFGAAAYSDTSPLRDMARRFGFYQPLYLDGGLLDGALMKGSVLEISPSRYGFYRSFSQLLRAAVGEQTVVTPLHISQLTLAIAQGERVQPRVIKAVDGRLSKRVAFPLGLKPETLPRLRAAMRFSAQDYHSFAASDSLGGIYAKTGTGEVSQGGVNNAWTTAFRYQDNHANPLVVTCFMQQVKGNSSLCARVVARAMAALDRSQVHP